jgi:hypothetical protein
MQKHCKITKKIDFIEVLFFLVLLQIYCKTLSQNQPHFKYTRTDISIQNKVTIELFSKFASSSKLLSLESYGV